MKHQCTSRSRLGLLVAGMFLGWGVSVSGQWVRQNVDFHPGWNAVYLEVDPIPSEPSVLFQSLPVESVWLWNRRFNPVQFIQDPNNLIPEDPDWLMHVPETSAAAARNSLFRIAGGLCYLIKISDNAAAFQMDILGRPVVRRTEWIANSYNLVGYTVNNAGPPTFQSFFGGASAHFDSSIFRLQPTGAWSQVQDPGSTMMSSGEAFWIYSKGASDFEGPIRVTVEQDTGLGFGRVLQDQTITFRNDSLIARVVEARVVNSLDPPDMTEPALAGSVPLSYWLHDAAQSTSGWADFEGSTVGLFIPPRGESRLRLAVRRADMDSFSLPLGYSEALYQSVLEISEAGGTVWRNRLPVSAEGLQSSAANGGSGGGASSGPDRTGLWVGNAVIGKVNQPASANPEALKEAGSEFQFRILVHVDENGEIRWLQNVVQMWKNGTLKPDPNNPLLDIVDEPGRYVLLTDNSRISQFTGAALRDGQPVGRRFSTAAFGFRQPLLMTDVGGFGFGTCMTTVEVDYDDPLNPFKHTYHPDHNNLDERYEQTLPEGRESFTVEREVELTFTAQDPEGFSVAGWGDSQLGGIYRETITGLHKDPLKLEGFFRIHRASNVGRLNDE